jgi:hypothetical protein
MDFTENKGAIVGGGIGYFYTMGIMLCNESPHDSPALTIVNTTIISLIGGIIGASIGNILTTVTLKELGIIVGCATLVSCIGVGIKRLCTSSETPCMSRLKNN